MACDVTLYIWSLKVYDLKTSRDGLILSTALIWGKRVYLWKEQFLKL